MPRRDWRWVVIYRPELKLIARAQNSDGVEIGPVEYFETLAGAAWRAKDGTIYPASEYTHWIPWSEADPS